MGWFNILKVQFHTPSKKPEEAHWTYRSKKYPYQQGTKVMNPYVNPNEPDPTNLWEDALRPSVPEIEPSSAKVVPEGITNPTPEQIAAESAKLTEATAERITPTNPAAHQRPVKLIESNVPAPAKPAKPASPSISQAKEVLDQNIEGRPMQYEEGITPAKPIPPSNPNLTTPTYNSPSTTTGQIPPFKSFMLSGGQVDNNAIAALNDANQLKTMIQQYGTKYVPLELTALQQRLNQLGG